MILLTGSGNHLITFIPHDDEFVAELTVLVDPKIFKIKMLTYLDNDKNTVTYVFENENINIDLIDELNLDIPEGTKIIEN